MAQSMQKVGAVREIHRPLHSFVLMLLAGMPCVTCGTYPSCGGTLPAVEPGGAEEAILTTPSMHPLHRGRNLVDEASRAELRAGGLIVDMGSPDQHKYTRGGWKTGWGRNWSRQGTSWAEFTDRAWLALEEPEGGVRSVVLRIRAAAPGHLLTLTVAGMRLIARPLSTSWQELEFPLPRATGPGPYQVRFNLRGPGSGGGVGHLDWIWMKTGKALWPGAVKVAIRRHGDHPQRSLVGDPPRRFSFHLNVADNSRLVFDTGANRPTAFQVLVAVDGTPPRFLFNRQVLPGKWHRHEVSLAEFAGRAARLDLITEGQGGLAAWGEPRIVSTPVPGPILVKTGTRPARNLIHIMVDCARQDLYRTFNPQSRVKTPAFQRLAAGGTAYSNAVAQANCTLPSVATMLTGRYAFTFMQSAEQTVIPPDYSLLSQLLGRHGLATGAFIDNPLISKPMGFTKGWDRFQNWPESKGREAGARVVYEAALGWITAQQAAGRRFYAYVHLNDLHHPYRSRGDHTRRHLPANWPGKGNGVVGAQLPPDDRGAPIHLRRAFYNGEASYHDEQLGRFLDGLERLGLLEETLVVHSNDHGEEFLEHGRYDHGHSLYEELLRAPLVLHYPPLFRAGQMVETQVELVDLLPTQLEVLGLPPMPGAHGISLAGHPAARRSPDYTLAYGATENGDGRSVRLGPHKLIQLVDREELYNLTRDPTEQEDLYHSHPVTRRVCEIHLAEGLGTPAKGRRIQALSEDKQVWGRPANLPTRLLRQLKALGYLK